MAFAVGINQVDPPAQDDAKTSVKARKYKCTYDKCSKVYTSTSGLRHHIDIKHKGIRYRCDQCDASFKQKHNMVTHVNATHKGQRPHKCDQCDQAFGHRSALTGHIKNIHRGLRPHQCGECDKKFAIKQDLKCHIKRVHQGIKDVCKECKREVSISIRGRCLSCIPLEERRGYLRFCQRCLVQHTQRRDRQGNVYCHSCYNQHVLKKSAKIRVEEMILSAMTEFDPTLMNAITSCDKAENVKTACHHRKDVCWIRGNRRLILEIDEGSHAFYDVSCELARISKYFESCVLPTVTVRLSDRNMDTLDVPWLCAFLKKLLVDPNDPSGYWPTQVGAVSLIYINYPRSSKHIKAAKNQIIKNSPIVKVFEMEA